MSVDISRGAVGGDRHAHEEIDIGDDIAAVEPELRQRFDEIAKAAMCAADAAAQEVVGLATASVDRVVPTVTIFHDRKQRVAEIRIQNRALSTNNLPRSLIVLVAQQRSVGSSTS